AVDAVNHVAIIVHDVGRSASFYADILGLQQIKRPNFDRHGAWFTAGNVELHLIKGEPLIYPRDGENLIVGHIALDTHRPAGVFAGLQALGIDLEMNVSVPKGTGKAASEGGSADNTLSQAFFRDPDGHYLEACNCHLLTSFCLGPAEGEEEDDDGFRYHLLQYEEGIRVPGSLTSSCAKLLIKASRAKKRNDHAAEVSWVPPGRDSVYGDLCQSFEPDEIAKILRESGNHAPTALLLME
ncbi:unnamed protein product, partial [Phaeothamnion confervicola]